MSDRALRKVVVVGGGTAGWMTALPLAQLLRKPGGAAPLCEVVLVESAEIGTIGVGEATLPTLRQYNQAVGLDPAEFLRRTQATFKLGIEFRDWGHLGHRFFHGFGDYGPPIENRSPWMHWLQQSGREATAPLEDWSMPAAMARANRFAPPQGGGWSPASAYSYAFHFDAGLFAGTLREQAERAGAQRVEGTIVGVERRAGDGFVEALRLADGRRVEGDLFVDCSGLRALLIEGEMQAGFEDWSAMLPCDSALAAPSARTEPLAPYTLCTAREAGWTWRIPLQHRTGNGHVFSSGFTSEAQAERVLTQALDGEALDPPRRIRFKPGRRRRSWIGNVVAIGLSSGFLEPLESTSIHLILDNVGSLIHYLPDRDFHPALAEAFNRKVAFQYEAMRDFLVLHYKLTRRDDSELWRYCAAMEIPDSLRHQIELFEQAGRVHVPDPNGFAEPSWVSILLGLGLRPRRLDPFLARIDEAALRTHLARVRGGIAQAVAAMPSHADAVARATLAKP
jgi:hypothetical protein